MNVYYDPEKFGLELVGMLDQPGLICEFNMLGVWKDKRTGELFYRQDSG